MMLVFHAAEAEGAGGAVGVGTLAGIARRHGFLKRWRDVYRVVNSYPELFRIKGKRVSLTVVGRKKAEELLGETRTVPVQLSRPKPNLYVLRGYTAIGGTKRVVNMRFYSEVLLLNRNHRHTLVPAEIIEVVGYTKCLTCGNTLNYQNPRPAERLPHIRYLTAYLLKELGNTCAKELELAVLKTLTQLYPDHKEYTLGQSKVYVVKTALSPLAVCPTCQSTSCAHTNELVRIATTRKT